MRKNFEHTADIGIEVETSNISSAFEEAALGFSELITGGNLPKELISNDVSIESDNLDSLLVHFISYLVVLFDTDLFIPGFAKIEISKGENFLLKGILKGDICLLYTSPIPRDE